MRRPLASLASCAIVFFVSTLRAQQISPLTALDYFQIHELNARFCFALDSGDGQALASLFAADGIFVDESGKPTSGAAQLAALAGTTPGTGPTNMGHFYIHLAMDPAPGGATAKSYISISTPSPGQPLNTLSSGQYWDDLVKTAQGWRIRKRTFYKSGTPRPATQPLATAVPRFASAPDDAGARSVTADDYAQIRQLYAAYGQYWDRPEAGGRSWADLFAADGTFVDAAGKTTTGRAKLRELIWSKGPWDYGSHITNIVVESAGRGVFATRAYYVRHRVVTAQFSSESNMPILRPAPPEQPSETFFGLAASQPGPDQPAAMLFGRIVRTSEGLRFQTLSLVKPHGPAPSATSGTVAKAAAAKAGPLSATDYADIEHLYARYAHGIDSKADNGALFGSVYLPDSFFRAEFDNYVTPNEKLMQTYGRTPSGQPAPIIAGGHQTYGIVIEPAPWGAYGLAHMGNGAYYDTLVKTSDGWRFKARNCRWDIAFPGARVDQARQAAPPPQ